MPKHLLLVDYENVHKVDLSVLDDTYRAIIFVGASQNPPKGARNEATAHRFKRVDFQMIAGSGKNALDFHIAFQLGRTFETAPDTVCIVLSRDRGFDPLLLHLNASGLKCRRVESCEALMPAQLSSVREPPDVVDPELVVCGRCNKASTIEHHGGCWCTNCGSFARPPDPNLLPSRYPGYREPSGRSLGGAVMRDRQRSGALACGWCHEYVDMADGIYDDGEWMCGGCVARYTSAL
jgi:hypothetical protein